MQTDGGSLRPVGRAQVGRSTAGPGQGRSRPWGASRQKGAQEAGGLARAVGPAGLGRSRSSAGGGEVGRLAREQGPEKGCPALWRVWLQGTFQTQGLNPCLLCLLHCRRLLYHCITWEALAAAAVKSLQSCPTLCSPTDSSPPGSPVPGPRTTLVSRE